MAAVPEDCTLSFKPHTFISSIDKRSETSTTRLTTSVYDPCTLSFKLAEWVEPSFGDIALTSLLCCPLFHF